METKWQTEGTDEGQLTEEVKAEGRPGSVGPEKCQNASVV